MCRARIIAVATALLCLLPAAPAAAWSRLQVADRATAGERAWEALTDPATGAVTDKIAPGPHAPRDYNYGTLMLADAQLRAAERIGDGALADRAVAVIMGVIARNGGRAPGDPFNQLAAATLMADGRAGALPAGAWARIQPPLEAMIAQIAPFTGHGFADPAVFDNWRLVWAAGAIQIADSGLVGTPGAIAENPAALRAEVQRIVSQLVPAFAGPAVATPYGAGRVLSDPGSQPLAYHVLSAVLLERIFQTDPGVFDPAALAIREQVGRYALALMAPDGQLTHSGRSMEQSWVLAAAADLGAMRAGRGEPDAPAWRAFAERALDRLVRAHGEFADGTIPVVPGLRVTPDQTIADHYSSMSQYNGLTLFFVEHAVARWPETVAAQPLAADRGRHLTADLAPGGSGLVWGRAGDVWWAIQGRRTAAEARASQGIVTLKVRDRRGWRNLLAARPNAGRPTTAWVLATRRGEARLTLERATGTGAHAVLTGHWAIGGRDYRTARWDVRVRERALEITTEPLRKGERMTAAVWVQPGLRPTVSRSGRAAPGPCRVTASGRACAIRLRFRHPGRATVALGR